MSSGFEGVTPGPWTVIDGTTVLSADPSVAICDAFPADKAGNEYRYGESSNANASLIAEAGTVLHETGLTPRQLADLVARLKLEAQGHAQEARTANATIAEIYQVCTGSTGEPGNWNGAEPVRQLAEQRAELLEALRGLYDELERDHYGAGYAPEPDEPMGIAKAALATQRKEPGA